jgi:DNA replication protein DnaD
MDKGWIKVYRQLQESSIWVSEEPFDNRSAWIDLIMMANIQTKKTVFRGKAIEIRRGQVCTSIRKLSVRWHWSPGRTRRFLKLLQDLEMIKHEKWHTGGTLLSLVKYDDFQSRRHSDEHTNGHNDRHSDEHTGGRLLKNNKNEKEIKESAPLVSDETAALEEEECVGLTDEEWDALGEDI